MGLLNRRRARPAAEGSPAASAVPSGPPEAPAGRGDDDVIRASTFTQVPDWATLPPMAPALPEMPRVLAARFEDSLVAWSPPKRFLEPLGHSVAASAPSGVVEGIAVLAPTQPTEVTAETAPSPGPATLPLAVPQPSSPKRAPVTVQTRTLARPNPSLTYETSPAWTEPAASEPSVSDPALPLPPSAVAPETLAAGSEPDPSLVVNPADAGPMPAAAEPDPGAASASGRELESAPEPPDRPAVEASSDLVGNAPLTPMVQRLVEHQSPAPRPSPLVSAPTPADMPLAQLPAARLPGEPSTQPSRLPDADAFGGDEEPAISGSPIGSEVARPTAAPETSGLLGARVIRARPHPPADPASPTVPSSFPESTPPEVPALDLPLAHESSPAPPGPKGQPERVAPGGDTAPSSSPVAEGAAAAVAPEAPPADPVAPLLGQSPDLATEPAIPAALEDRSADQVPGRSTAPGSEASPPLPLAPSPGVARAGPTEVVAPLLGQDPSVGGGDTPSALGPDDGGAAAGSVAPDRAGAPLAPPRPPSVPRVGLGEPMAHLPPTATTWDITTLSPAQQLRVSRSLIQRQMAGPLRGALTSGRPSGPPDHLTPGPGQPDGGQLRGPVLAGMPLPVAALEDLGPAAAGVAPVDLPLATPEQAPLLAMDPLLGADQGDSESPRSGSSDAASGSEARGAPRPYAMAGRGPDAAPSPNAWESRRPPTSSLPAASPGPGSSSGPALGPQVTRVLPSAALGGSGQIADLPVVNAMGPGAEAAMPGAAAPAQPYVLEPTDVPKPVARDHGGGGTLPLASPPAGPDGDMLAQSILQRLSDLGGAAPGGTTVMTSSWHAVAQAAPPLPVVQRDTTTAAPAATTTSATTDTTTSATSTTATLPIGAGGKRPDDQELRNLSQWLYPFISHRLKGELREGRERAGLLTDSYRRW